MRCSMTERPMAETVLPATPRPRGAPPPPTSPPPPRSGAGCPSRKNLFLQTLGRSLTLSATRGEVADCPRSAEPSPEIGAIVTGHEEPPARRPAAVETGHGDRPDAQAVPRRAARPLRRHGPRAHRDRARVRGPRGLPGQGRAAAGRARLPAGRSA